MGAGAAAALSDGAATAAGETEGASLEESAEKKERRSGFWEGSQKEGRRVEFLLAPPSPATSSTIAKNEKKKLKEEQRRAEKSKTPLSSNNDSAAPNRRTMRVTPGETDALPTRAAPAAGAAGGAPLTRRTSFAATTAISRRTSNAAAAADASKGGDYEEGLPLDVVEEPDSLTEHGMPVVFEVRQAEMQGGGREAKGEEGPIREKRPGGRRAAAKFASKKKSEHAGTTASSRLSLLFLPCESQEEQITARARWTESREWSRREQAFATRAVEREKPNCETALQFFAISFSFALSLSLSSLARFCSLSPRNRECISQEPEGAEKEKWNAVEYGVPAEEEKNKSCPSLPGTSLALSLTSTPFPPRPLFQKKKKKTEPHLRRPERGQALPEAHSAPRRHGRPAPGPALGPHGPLGLLQDDAARRARRSQDRRRHLGNAALRGPPGLAHVPAPVHGLRRAV